MWTSLIYNLKDPSVCVGNNTLLVGEGEEWGVGIGVKESN